MEHCGARQQVTLTLANRTTIRLQRSIAMGAVRWTARRLQPGGSSKPRCCLLPWLLSLMDHWPENSRRIVVAAWDVSVE